MADSRAPRASTDEENAPLLTDPTTPAHTEPTLAERINAIISEPLTGLSKLLLVILLVLLLLSSVFIGLFAGAQHKLNKHKNDGGHGGVIVTTTATATITAPGPVPTGKDETCLTADCIRLSADILSSIDESYDPCENFYEFANNGWLKDHPLPPGKGVFGSFNALAVENQQFLRELLESDSVPTPTTADDKKYDELLISKVRGMYKSCMNEDLLDKQDSEPLKKVVKQVRDLYHGETLVIKGQGHEIKHDRNLTAALAYLHSRDIGALFSLEVEGDAVVDPDAMNLWFTQPSLGLPSKEYYDEPAIVSLYQMTLERLLIELDESGNYTQDDTMWISEEEGPAFADQMTKEDRSYAHKIGQRAMHKLNTYELTGRGEDTDADDYAVSIISPEFEGFEDVEVDEDWVLVDKPQASSMFRTQDPEHDQDQDQSWPPWPFPPWDGDEDDGNKDDEKKKPINYTALAASVIEFEKKIANASLDLDILQRDPWITYNPMPLKNLSALLPQVAFNEYIAAFTPRNFAENVIVTYPAYASALGQLLNETSAEVIEAYLVSRVALSLAPLLGQASEAWQAHRRLVEVLSGIKPGAVADRFEYCVGKVESTLGFAAGRYFVKEKFPGASREKGTKVITDVVKAFKASLGDLEWMDKKSGKRAAQKADALDVKVGYPESPDTNNARALLVYYYQVKSDEEDFVGNILSSRASDVYKMWQKLGKRRNKKEWLMYPSQVNAYYNPPANEIVFPAGILQPPFFSQSWPGYLSYGAFGVVAAHELTHAFDSMGRLYNPDGKLEEWWTNSTSEAFKSKEKCIVDQYAGYYVEDAQGNKVYVNGNLTSGENIGDSGIIQAYRAWKAQYDGSLKDGGEFVLPGLPYTKEQLFFIAFGRVWAQNIKPAAAVQRVRTDPHSPNQFRVEGTLRNVPEFAKAFNCSAKARLNPPMKDRCMFWG